MYKSRELALVALVSRNRDTPFQCLRSWCHMRRSFLHSALMYTRWWSASTVYAAVNSLDMKVRPAGMTRAAKPRWPIRLRSSPCVDLVRPKKLFTSAVMRVNLSGGKRASMARVSRVMPRYSRMGAGPKVLGSDRGMLSTLNMCFNRAMAALPFMPGGRMQRKSSNKWRVWGRL